MTCCHPRKDIPSSPRSRKSWKSRVHWNKESRYSCECGQIACLVYWMMVGWIQNKPHPHNWAAFLCRIWHWLEYIEICEGIKKAKWAVFSHAAVELFLSMLKGKLQWTCFFYHSKEPFISHFNNTPAQILCWYRALLNVANQLFVVFFTDTFLHGFCLDAFRVLQIGWNKKSR